MGIHHVAIAVRDLAVAHRFYTDAMGFRLVHAQAGVTDYPDGTGWAKHVFYDTGDGALLALWDLHDPRIEAGDFALSRGLGFPNWVNNLAFDADHAGLPGSVDRWLRCGLDVLRIDHGWTQSAYTEDPDGNLVEWCATIKPFGPDEADLALGILEDPAPRLEPLPDKIEFIL